MAERLREFPNIVSLTLTNRCNLECAMCAQWSREGYMRNRKAWDSYSGSVLPFESWCRIIDEVHEHGVPLIIRGGEPLLHPRIADLLAYIKNKGVKVSLETNAVLLGDFAETVSRLGIDHLTVSVDGPEEIHDRIRGVPGTFARLRDSLGKLEQCERRYGVKIERGVTCTVSDGNYHAVGSMGDVARQLGFAAVCIVPFYFVPEKLGRAYEKLMREKFSCQAYSWRGFHRERSGVDVDEFLRQLRQFEANLDGLHSYPYMAFSDEEYREWFTKADTTVHQDRCQNIWGLLDVQPDGNVNFCVDFPDYAIGNVADGSLHQLWHSDRAMRFRELRSQSEMPVCYRCGAKYMG